MAEKSIADSNRIIEKSLKKTLKQTNHQMLLTTEPGLPLLISGFADVQHLLTKNGIRARIQGRIKSAAEIRSKMLRTGKTIDEIMDRVGLRIIVNSVLECYFVLGLLHAHYSPIPGSFDDYINRPKSNGYQSLHTCVYPLRKISDMPIEFQVRTELMHMEAEHGAAAHWRYKAETTHIQKTPADRKWRQAPLFLDNNLLRAPSPRFSAAF
jgi:(p)ppGpp synthase/HD superfamily hydrolase